jgi:hypothetical protein
VLATYLYISSRHIVKKPFDLQFEMFVYGRIIILFIFNTHSNTACKSTSRLSLGQMPSVESLHRLSPLIVSPSIFLSIYCHHIRKKGKNGREAAQPLPVTELALGLLFAGVLVVLPPCVPPPPLSSLRAKFNCISAA